MRRVLPLRMRTQRSLFAVTTIALALAAVSLATLAIDVYVHTRLARYAALNVWGYRGPTVSRKREREQRIFVIGGSTVFGVGYSWEAAFPVKLEQELRTRASFPVSVVNLGFPGENAFAYRATLDDFRFLQPDVVIFYGDNNVDVTAPVVLRHESAVFRLTGYYPLLPTAMREKAMALEHDGNVGAGYRNEPLSKPHVAARVTAFALARLAALGSALQYPLDRIWPDTTEPDGAELAVVLRTCGAPWTDYCDAMYRAVADARRHGYRVFVVNQPYASPRCVEEQRTLRQMLHERFGGDSSVQYLDLGWALDLHDPALAYDGMHLTPEGNRRIAHELAEHMWGVLGDESS